MLTKSQREKMKQVITNVPPVAVIRDGRCYIEVNCEGRVILAPVQNVDYFCTSLKERWGLKIVSAGPKGAGSG